MRPTNGRVSRPITVAPAVRASPPVETLRVVIELNKEAIKKLRLPKRVIERLRRRGSYNNIVSFGQGGTAYEPWFKITSARPAKPNDLVMATGAGFGPPGTVAIGSVPARVRKWGQRRIVFRVPPEATTNPVILNCPREPSTAKQRKASEQAAARAEQRRAILYIRRK